MNIKTNWDLEEYFYSSLQDGNLKSDIKKIKEGLDEQYDKWKDTNFVISSSNIIFNFLVPNEILSNLVAKVQLYLYRLTSLDTNNLEANSLIGELDNIMLDDSNRWVAINKRFELIGAERMIELANLPEFIDYKKNLLDKAENLKDSLAEKEQIIYNEIYSAMDEVYSEYSNVIDFVKDGITYNKSILYDQRTDPDPEKRKLAWDLLYSTYSQKIHQIYFSSLYRQVVKSTIASLKIYKKEDVMYYSVKSEEMEISVVNKLLDIVSKDGFPLYQKFLKLKAKYLSKEKLDYWDILAPIGEDKTKYTYEQGCKMYLELIKDFDEEFYDISLNMIENGLVDVFPSDSKVDGAYSASCKNFPSFILLNYVDNLRQVSTLAHEMGHTIHGTLSQKQPSNLFNPSLCVCETASIFNETLLMNNELSKLDKENKVGLLFGYLDDIFSTAVRQIMYTLFEKEVHEEFKKGKELTYKDFNEIWLKYSKQYYGDTVNELPDFLGSGWSVIPHFFHSPFYCYSYSFGNLLSFAMYDKYKTMPKKEFLTIYKDLLSMGSRYKVKELLSMYNIDIESDNFYKSGLTVIENYINELEN